MYSSRQSLDNLPDHFVQAMRTLFDIMDVDRSGYIRYEDLARRWADNPPEATGIPAGFLDCLREVTPVNGMLNFERFRAGLRLALSLNSREKENDALEGRINPPTRPPKKEGLIKRRSPPHAAKRGSRAALIHQQHARRYGSQPVVNELRNGNSTNGNYENIPPYASSGKLDSSGPESGGNYSNYENMDVLRQQRARSSGQQLRAVTPITQRPAAPPPYNHAIGSAKSVQSIPTTEEGFQSNGLRRLVQPSTQGPSPPLVYRQSKPRLSDAQQQYSNGNRNSSASNAYRSSMSISSSQPSSASLRQAVPPPQMPKSTIPGLVEGSNLPKIAVAKSRPISVQTWCRSSAASSGDSPSSAVVTVVPPRPDHVRWRNKSNLTVITDQRRHTITDGRIESLPNKHSRVLEEERELLERGLEMVSRLKNWYNERLTSLDTRQRYAGKSMIPLDLAVHEEKLNFLRAHVTEANRRMGTLMESSEKGFPTHINLETTRMPQPEDDKMMWLKKQNQALTQEVSAKSEEIRKLEGVRAELEHKIRVASAIPSQATSSLSSGTPSPPSTDSRRGSPPSRFQGSQYRSGSNQVFLPPFRNSIPHHTPNNYEATLI